jgi:hypothetical protein
MTTIKMAYETQNAYSYGELVALLNLDYSYSKENLLDYLNKRSRDKKISEYVLSISTFDGEKWITDITHKQFPLKKLKVLNERKKCLKPPTLVNGLTSF